MASNLRPEPDPVLTDIARYVLDYKVDRVQTFTCARLCLMDAIGCAIAALNYPACTKLLGPIVPGIVVPHGSRVPGTPCELDPAAAAFSLGCIIRWLDFNDTFTAAQGSHPSDNLAGILALSDYLSRKRVADGENPLIMRDVLEALVKAYEIQGCLAIENDFNEAAVDHVVLTRVATSAVLTRMLGGGLEEIVNAVSNAWIDNSLRVYRQAPNTGSRKGWAAAEASFQAVRLALMAVKGEMGYPSVLTAKRWGLYDALFDGRPFRFQRPYGSYVIEHSMFKPVAAGMHGQSAVECAFRLHPLVSNRLQDVSRVVISSQRALMGVMDKTGPLYNPADRDHCVQYVVAIGLIFGRLTPAHFEDDIAADPRIDALREKMAVVEDERYTRDFYAPDKRSSANAVQVYFNDGSSTPKVEVEYPLGHPRRRDEAMPALMSKFRDNLDQRFPPKQRDAILRLFDDAEKLDTMPVHRFVDRFVT